MSDEIKPALTPDEWAAGRKEVEREGGYVGTSTHYVERAYVALNADGGLYVYRMGNAAILVPDLIPAAAAFLLQRAGPDGKPLFTRADVAFLRQLNDYSWDRAVSEQEYAEVRAEIARQAAICDTLASLHCPEGKRIRWRKYEGRWLDRRCLKLIEP